MIERESKMVEIGARNLVYHGPKSSVVDLHEKITPKRMNPKCIYSIYVYVYMTRGSI